MTQPASRTMMKSYYLIIFLLVLTPALLIWQHFGMTRIIEISPRQPYGARVTDDREDNNGNSRASLVRSGDALIMRCELGRAAAYPFCKLQFLLGVAGKGVDLSQFDTIVFNMGYSEPSPQYIKLHLMNFEPDISTVGDWNSQRFNEAEMEPAGRPTFTIPFQVLRTADWWRGVRKVPLTKSYPRFDNVTAVELSTGSIPPGQLVAIELRSIQFRGKWISQATLLMYLVSAWIGFGILGLLSVQTRTAELRQQTRYLRTLIDTLPLWVWLKDTGDHYLTVNQAKAAACGRSVDEMVGKADHELWPPELPAPYLTNDTEVIATRQRVTVEQAIESANGLVWMETYRAPVLDEDGTLLGMVGVARDISDRKAAEAAREAALAEAVGLARQRSSFLAQMSHELRTPLNAIMGYTQLLQRDRQQLTERQAAGLATIQESSQHLLTLINDILDLARVEAGKMVLHPTAAHLDGFLRVVADIMRVKAEEKGLLFSFEPADDLPAAVTIDETRLRQVLLNLLGNAVKFTDRGAVSLRVLSAPPADGAADRGGEATARIRFEVADSGIGMSAQQLGKLFHPFEQVADMARRRDGTGLGLAISQQLVRLMGGDIGVVSEPDKGSVFWFELAVPVATDAPAIQPVPRRTITGYEGERRRLLIVDDVPQNRAMLMEMLQALGFVVASAGNGLECLALLDSFKPDLIVMDVMMPEVDGNEATRRIRRLPEWRRIPIIAVTASASHEDELKCREAGVDAFLVKPIDHDVLLNAIGAQLSLRWTTRQAPLKPQAPDNEECADLVIPPAQEIEALWQLARIGNMRTIKARAEYVAALDPAYTPFAQRLRTMAQGFQSKALLAFLERHRAESTVPPL
ncbi:response regulator [Pseudoduganella namucuonensis]|uniref:Virulence sensor protein BvgS n=1 Tax=Pseudoduganella namucuonensis TaxID=1035707 RepID=A0A1I7ILK0_9BURK|nr:response regulator [Pseudoduganella namucuonensis]SFU73819.1 PAS domain S-box-containing protein [Pseudoduganella namucuonensis]